MWHQGRVRGEGGSPRQRDRARGVERECTTIGGDTGKGRESQMGPRKGRRDNCIQRRGGWEAVRGIVRGGERATREVSCVAAGSRRSRGPKGGIVRKGKRIKCAVTTPRTG